MNLIEKFCRFMNEYRGGKKKPHESEKGISNPKEAFPNPTDRLDFLCRCIFGTYKFSVEDELFDIAKNYPELTSEASVALADLVFKMDVNDGQKTPATRKETDKYHSDGTSTKNWELDDGSRIYYSEHSAQILAQLGDKASSAVNRLAKIMLLEPPHPSMLNATRSDSVWRAKMALKELIPQAQEAAINALEGIGTEEARLALKSPLEAITDWDNTSCACDICDSPIQSLEGYMLTTRQVAESPEYWRDYYGRHSSQFQDMGINSLKEFKDNSKLSEQTTTMITGQVYPWIVCENCISLFNVDKAHTKEDALKWWKSDKMFHPEEYGPIPKHLAALKKL